MKTKTHEAADDLDAQVLLDADLAVLGASPTIYRKYADNIRLEYAWVPKLEYQTGRRQVLSKFLTRPRIYHFLTHLEEPARQNITAEIGRLTTA
jgi:predicted metal-dependent HD superfamily phosphohydrolase